jgi:hypothetical protein
LKLIIENKQFLASTLSWYCHFFPVMVASTFALSWRETRIPPAVYDMAVSFRLKIDLVIASFASIHSVYGGIRTHDLLEASLLLKIDFTFGKLSILKECTYTLGADMPNIHKVHLPHANLSWSRIMKSRLLLSFG